MYKDCKLALSYLESQSYYQRDLEECQLES